MPKVITIQAGEGISSIAARFGFSPDRIWKHPDNSTLRAARHDPDILMPGDSLTIPDRVEREQACATDLRHRFKRKGVPAYLRLQFLVEHKPRANEPFRLELESATFEGKTDSDGVIQMFVPNDARRGTLYLGKEREQFTVLIGEMDPAGEMRGIQKRLANLGLFEGEIDGQESAELTAAIRAFQTLMQMPVNGRLDSATRDKLERSHDTTERPTPPDEDEVLLPPAVE